MLTIRWPDFSGPRTISKRPPIVNGPAQTEGFRCTWPLRGVLLQCPGCSNQSSVTAGTIFQDTRKPLTLWFRAMWSVISQKNGASAIGLQRELGLRSYKTAWTWFSPLRPHINDPILHVRRGRRNLRQHHENDRSV